MADTQQFKYDVFRRHSAKDKTVVRVSQISTQIPLNLLPVPLGEWEIQPGDLIGKRAQENLETSLVPVLFSCGQ